MTPATPGVSVISGQAAPSSIPNTDTGTWFVTGQTEKGPSGEPVECLNLAAYEAVFGGRSGGITLYDAVQTFFAEGGARCIVAREVGPAVATATITAKNGSSENALKMSVTSPGAWGNDVDVVVVGASTTRVYQVKYLGTLVEESPSVTTNAEAVAWAAANSAYVRFEDLGKGLPAAGTKELAAGTDDRESITETQHEAALALFAAHLGPGQVSSPGRVTAEAHKAILAHAKAKNRLAILDGTDTATVSTLTTLAGELRSQSTARYGGLFAPWVKVPGITPGTERTVPPCALIAGLAARNDGSGGNPNDALAGISHRARYAIGVSQVAWSGSNRSVLHEAGVNVVRKVNADLMPYDNVTLVNSLTDATWAYLSNARLNMAICSRSEAVAETHLFAQIDGQGIELSKFNGDLAAVLLGLWEQGALFGEVPEEAFTVETGAQVNTEKTLEEGKLKAVLAVKMSPSAERVEIEVVKEAL